MLELRKHRKFRPSQQVHVIWILEPTDEHLIVQANYLKSLFENENKTELFMQKREGDYPPKKLSD